MRGPGVDSRILLRLRSGGLKALLLLCAVLGLIRTAQAADLLTLYRDSLANNAGYAAARANHAAALETLPQARALLLPAISADSQATRTRLENETVFLGNTTETTYGISGTSYGLTLSQPVYRKQLWAQYDQAQAQIREAESRLASAWSDLALRLAQAYFAALLAEDNVRLSDEQTTAIAAQLQQAKRLYESGFGTVTDVNEAQARLDSSSARKIAAGNTLEISLHTLAEISGNLPDTLRPLSENPPLSKPDPDDLAEWIEFAYSRNPSVNAISARREIARQEIARARAGHLPTLDMLASWRHDNNPGTSRDTRNETAEVGLRLNIPLYQGGFVDSRTRQTAAQYAAAGHDLEAVRRQVAQQTRQEYLNVVNGIAQVQALEQALKSHEVALYSMEKGFTAGVRTSVDILNQQQLLYTAKRDLFEARYGYLLSRMRLKAVAGLLDEEEITLVNGWLVGIAHGEQESMTLPD